MKSLLVLAFIVGFSALVVAVMHDPKNVEYDGALDGHPDDAPQSAPAAEISARREPQPEEPAGSADTAARPWLRDVGTRRQPVFFEQLGPQSAAPHKASMAPKAPREAEPRLRSPHILDLRAPSETAK